jgi:hypothetical protein
LGSPSFTSIFWIGGNYSFNYTHDCVRSHKEWQVINNEGDEELVTICDFYSANSKRWTLLDPARSVATSWVTGWVDAAILGGVAVVIVSYVLYGRRKERLEREWRLHHRDFE